MQLLRVLIVELWEHEGSSSHRREDPVISLETGEDPRFKYLYMRILTL
jgi:hypothetical protein